MVESLRDGRYIVHGLLGEGAQGTTLEAVDRLVGRSVAIKRFDVRAAKAWKDVELAEREARVLAALGHPKLPTYIEHFEENGALYLVMEKIEGESLAVLQRRGQRLDGDTIIRLLSDSAEVLDYLHQRVPPVIHRDLKPGNVIRRPDGSFAFVDFGSVRDLLRPEGGSTVVGTFGFMAPEQFQGRALPATDVYAVGATCLALLTGRAPEQLPHRGLAIDVEAALAGIPLPDGLVSVLSSMLEPDPDRRPARLGPLLDRIHSGRRPFGGSPTRASAPPPADADADSEPDSRPPWEQEILRNLGEVGVRLDGRLQKRIAKYRRRLERMAEKAARDHEKHERRAQRREAEHEFHHHGFQHHVHPHELPLFLRIGAIFGLTVALVTLTLVVRIAVPILLTFLSLFFGPGLVRAARRTSEAGERASRRVEAALRMISRDDRAPTAPEASDADRSRAASDARPEAGSTDAATLNDRPAGADRVRARVSVPQSDGLTDEELAAAEREADEAARGHNIPR